MTARQHATYNNTREKNDRWEAVLAGDKSGFEVCHVPGMGRGIKTTRPFMHKEILMRYFGQIISEEEAQRREDRGPKVGHFYRYKFKVSEKKYVLDATSDDGTFGRLINHSKKKPKVWAKPVEIDGSPAIVFVAMGDIESGIELRYDYGERRKHVIKDNPWLKH